MEAQIINVKNLILKTKIFLMIHLMNQHVTLKLIVIHPTKVTANLQMKISISHQLVYTFKLTITVLLTLINSRKSFLFTLCLKLGSIFQM